MTVNKNMKWKVYDLVEYPLMQIIGKKWGYFYAHNEQDLEILLTRKDIDNLDYIEGLVILKEYRSNK